MFILSLGNITEGPLMIYTLIYTEGALMGATCSHFLCKYRVYWSERGAARHFSMFIGQYMQLIARAKIVRRHARVEKISKASDRHCLLSRLIFCDNILS